MIRIETAQGTLARRGFIDPETAERIIARWDTELEVLVDILASSADPDLALSSLSRLEEGAGGLLRRLAATPALARRLIMVLGASAALGRHLITHPEQVELLAGELARRPAAELRAELLR